MKKLLSFLSFLLVSISTYASHISGGEITYISLGNNQYEVHYTVYWDCTGGFNPGSSQSISVDGCLGSQNVTLNQSPLTPGDGVDISQICASATSTCNGGTINGNNMIDYVGIVTLPGGCTDWVFSYNTCCRNGLIVNLDNPDVADVYAYALLNNLNAPNNNSPVFTAQPLPYLCVNQPACYNFGVVEQDGNTLQYSLISAMGTSPTDPLTYSPGFTGTAPIPGITINATTGQLNFTPTAQGTYVVVVLVQEFDANGVLVGEVIRDVQMVVQNCNNLTIGCGSGGLNSGNVTGNGAVLNPLNPYELQICEGIPFSFNVTFTDPNAADSLKIRTNLATNPALAGSTATVTYPIPGQPNNVALNFSWTAPAGSANQNTFLTVTVFDNACPIPGQQVVNYFINILPAANAGPDTTICLGDAAVLHGSGPGGPYNWFDLGGIMMATGPQMSCNPCQEPTVTPNVTTTYVIQTSGGAGCVNRDTVTITVVPTFNWALTPGPTASGCTGNPIQLGITPNPVGVYSYVWTPTTGLDMPMVSTPLLTMADAETVTYSVTVTSNLGCIKRDSIVVTAQQGPPPFTIRNDTCMTAIPPAPLQLDVEFPCLSGASCSLSPGTACTGSSNLIQVGTNTTPNFTNPSPFMGVWEDGRAQYLFRAAELQALGLGQGIINSIALNVSSVGGQSYAGLTVKIKCTATNAFAGATGAFEAGATTVYTSPLYAPFVGLNTFNFTSPYAYDGVSNLLIEFCYDNDDWSGGDEVLSTATAFQSSITFDQDGQVGCNVPNSETVYSERPNVTFNFSSSVNPANYTYNWSPAIGLSNPNIKNPTVTPPSGSTTYTVTVTTLNGLCSRNDSVTFSIGGGVAQIVTTDSIFCNSDPIQLFSLSPVTPTGGTWAHHINGSGNGGGVVPAGNTSNFHPELSVLGNSHVVYTVGPADCMITDSVLVLVSQKIPADFTTFGPFCEYNTPVTLSAYANNAGGTWTINNVAATQFDPPTLGPSVAPGYSVKYKTDLGVGCPDSVTKFVEVFDAPVIDFSADTLAGCLPSVPVLFTSTVSTPASPTSYSWSFGDASTTSLANPVHVYTQAGVFTISLTYTDINGCVDTETKTGYITINSVPEPEFIYEPSNPTSLEPHVDFLNTTPNGAGLSYFWNIADLDSADYFNVSYDFPGEGTYNVTLSATTINGCYAEVTHPVIITPDFAFYVPNSFSPNNDGKNDEFLPKSTGVLVEDYTLAIYDRWGERVFLTHNLSEGWKGSLSNNQNISTESGVFIYKIIYKDAFLKQRSVTGHVNLVR
jgi:gliding motility-associated-like protein